MVVRVSLGHYIHRSTSLKLLYRCIALEWRALSSPFSALLRSPRLTAAQIRTDTTFIGVRPAFPVASLVLREPVVLRAPWLGAPRTTPALRGLAWDSTISAVLDSARLERAAALRNLTLYGQAIRDQPAESTETRGVRRGVLGLSPKYADLALDGQVRLELRTDRLRN
jgi:hypothetical protein